MSEGCVGIWPFSLRRLPPLASTRLVFFSCVLQTVAHLPLLAPRLLVDNLLHQFTDSCAVSLDLLPLARCTALPHFHPALIPHARNSCRLFHTLLNIKLNNPLPHRHRLRDNRHTPAALRTLRVPRTCPHTEFFFSYALLF